MELPSRIIKNSTIYLITQVISIVVVFLYTVYMTRYLSPYYYGIITFGLSMIGIFQIFTDLGLNTLMTREISRDKSQNLIYFSNFITIKIFLSALIFLPTLLIIKILNYSGVAVYVLLVLMLSMVLTTFSTAFYALFQSYEKLEYQSAAIFFTNILTLIGVLIAIHYELNVVAFAFIYLFVGVFSLVYCILIAYKNFILPKILIDLTFWKEKLKLALRFGLIGIFTTIYIWIDSSMLFFIQGSAATGFYGAAYRIILALVFIPTAINLAVFPVMSILHTKSKDSLQILTERYFKYMLIVGIPIGISITILAPEIIIFLYGKAYANSILIFQILIWALVFIFASASFIQFFTSTNRELVFTKITGIWMVLNVILNLLLIPNYSYIGASVNTLITEFGVAFLLILAYTRTITGFNKRNFFILLSKIIIATTIIGIFVWIFQFINLLILIVLTIVLYLIISYLIGIIDQYDIEVIMNFLHRK